MIIRLIMFLCHIEYKRMRRKQKLPILTIRGVGEDYPKYLLYTENESVRNRMEDF